MLLICQLDPSALRWNAIICSNRAAANMSLGMHSDAISDCNQAIQKDPDFSKAYLRRARAYRVSIDSTIDRSPSLLQPMMMYQLLLYACMHACIYTSSR